MPRAHYPNAHRLAAVKEHVRAATTASGTLASDFENGDTIDGVTLATGDRILIKDQGSAENGIYVVAATGAPARAYDMNTGAEALGALVYVRSGTANGGKVFRNTNASLPTLGVTTLTFAELGSGSALTVKEIDGSPSVSPVTTLRLPSGALTDDTGGQVTWQPKGALEVVIDGGGVAITTGVKGDVEMPFAGTFTTWRLLADTAGAIVVDVWKDTYTNFPPADADAMPGSGKEPTIPATNAKAEDTTITDWTTDDFAAGDIIRFNVDSCTSITRVTLSLTYVRT